MVIRHQHIIVNCPLSIVNYKRPRSTMDSIRVSEAPDPGSIPGEATKNRSMYYAYVIKSVDHDYVYKGNCHDL